MVTTARVVPLRPDVATDPTPAPAAPAELVRALDATEAAAREAGVLYVDVQVALALARHLTAVVGSVTLGAAPSVAQVHAYRELRLATTELGQLVLGHARARSR